MSSALTPTARLSLGIFTIFLMIGVYVPFLPAWFKSRGLSPQEVGVVFAAALWARIPISLFLAHFADRSGRRKGILIAAGALVLTGFIAFTFLHGYEAILIGWIIVGTVLTTMVPLTDNLAVIAITRHGAKYGQIRLWGSISFITASFLGGLFLQGRSDDAILVLLIAAAAAATAGMALLPDHRTAPRRARRWPVIELLSNRRFMVFIFSAAFLQSSHAALYGFATLAWRSAGIGDGAIGFLWAEGVVFEILLFTFGQRILLRFGVWKLLAMAALAGIIRWTALGSSADFTLLIAVQSLHALTFAGTHLAAVTFIARNVPGEQSASAQGLYSGLAMGFVFAIAMLLAGWAYQHYATGAFYVMVVFSALGGVGALALGAMPRPLIPDPLRD
ncbi:MFS transporter [Varunaivibrio sulfuroxidans]|uniref:PPP family 3-phenylpropionic acid transporter n=1 Tax=Varunaivibrio sulfuroxidans TaxID=1773489 RepID=A0A4R3JFD8_9PROT|nr:MFS transporter [Varunaivibrio sulfuroxidans]TCS63973.1 PPP family 3-phenylpropionic acid transporter [Varunaivibrio sulfuroxidans]WES31574.1 MFS transporter [Varunaivibrio sulfuroxidans]